MHHAITAALRQQQHDHQQAEIRARRKAEADRRTATGEIAVLKMLAVYSRYLDPGTVDVILAAVETRARAEETRS
jgi:hypothetical protein